MKDISKEKYLKAVQIIENYDKEQIKLKEKRKIKCNKCYGTGHYYHGLGLNICSDCNGKGYSF